MEEKKKKVVLKQQNYFWMRDMKGLLRAQILQFGSKQGWEVQEHIWTLDHGIMEWFGMEGMFKITHFQPLPRAGTIPLDQAVPRSRNSALNTSKEF